MEFETETRFVTIVTNEASTIRLQSNTPAARTSARVQEVDAVLKPPTVELVTIDEQRAKSLWVYTDCLDNFR